MSPFIRLVEFCETAMRLASCRLSHVAALERFHAARGIPAPAREALSQNLGLVPGERLLVSIVVLSLNGADMLRTLFASVERHNHWPDVEILVIDHGGDNETASVIADAGRRLNIRHLKPGRNFSFAFSCNRAAQIARGDVLVFLNNDIEFMEDMLPRIVAAARSGKNLVGVKFWNEPSGSGKPATPQTGIRFRWNERQGWTVPYEAMVEDPFADRPCEVPAITAAVLGVSRSRFLEIGGFHESYLYAYEDVDLCLKAAARFGMKCLSLNDVSARHLFGATRFRRSSRKRRRDWHRYNKSVFRSRCGYLARRLAWLGLFDASGLDWGRGPAMALIDGRVHTKSLAGIEAVRCGFAGYKLYGYDVVVCREPKASGGRMRHLGPMALRVAWPSDPSEDWSSVSDFYDIVVTGTDTEAATLSRSLGRPVHCLDGGLDAKNLRALLAEFIRNRFRVVLIGSPQLAEARILADRLRRDGHSAHLRRTVEPREMLRYDAAVWFDPADEELEPGTIHVAAFDMAGDRGFYDVHAGALHGDFGRWYATLMEEVIARHKELVSGPADAPLEGISAFDDAEAETFWSGRKDLTAGLIAGSTTA